MVCCWSIQQNPKDIELWASVSDCIPWFSMVLHTHFAESLLHRLNPQRLLLHPPEETSPQRSWRTMSTSGLDAKWSSAFVLSSFANHCETPTDIISVDHLTAVDLECYVFVSFRYINQKLPYVEGKRISISIGGIWSTNKAICVLWHKHWTSGKPNGDHGGTWNLFNE